MKVRWSREILDEVHRNLVSTGLTDERRATRLIQTLLLVFPDALVTRFEALLPSMANHPNDRHVLAAAAHAGVDLLVTLNVRDFPASAASPHGVRIVAPDSLLNSLLDSSPDEVVSIIVEQARDLIAPPITVADVIAELEQTAPSFAANLRRWH